MLGKKKNNKVIEEPTYKVSKSLNSKDYSNDPFVKKKVESVKRLIEKYGLPKELTQG